MLPSALVIDRPIQEIIVQQETNSIPELALAEETAGNSETAILKEPTVHINESLRSEDIDSQIAIDPETEPQDHLSLEAIIQDVPVQQEVTVVDDAPTHETIVTDEIESLELNPDVIEQAVAEETEQSETVSTLEQIIESPAIPVQAENLLSNIAEVDNPSEEFLTAEIETYLESMGHDIDLATEELLAPVTQFVEITGDIQLAFASHETIQPPQLSELIQTTTELLDALGIDTTEEAIVSTLRHILPEEFITEYLQEITLLIHENGTYEFNQWNLPANVGPSKKRFSLHHIGRMALGLQAA